MTFIIINFLPSIPDFLPSPSISSLSLGVVSLSLVDKFVGHFRPEIRALNSLFLLAYWMEFSRLVLLRDWKQWASVFYEVCHGLSSAEILEENYRY